MHEKFMQTLASPWRFFTPLLHPFASEPPCLKISHRRSEQETHAHTHTHTHTRTHTYTHTHTHTHTRTYTHTHTHTHTHTRTRHTHTHVHVHTHTHTHTHTHNFLYSGGTDCFEKFYCRIFQPQRQWCMNILLPWAQKLYTPLRPLVLRRGEKTPKTPKISALLRKRPVLLRANFVLTKDRKRPY